MRVLGTIIIMLISSLVRFYKLFFASLSREGFSENRLFRIGLKRAAWLLFGLFFFPFIIVWNHAGFVFDDLFFPGWRSVKIVKPVFLVGNARSGTTWTHRILAQNDRVLTSPVLWEILFAQSVSWRVLFRWLGRIDAFFFSPANALLRCLDKATFGRSNVHPMGRVF